VAVLDLPQSKPFNAQQAKPIFDWIMYARQVKDWTPDLLALLRRIARDQRLRTPTDFDQIFERNGAVTNALMPDILDMIDADGIGQNYTVARQVAYTFPRLDPSYLQPHASEILALLDRDQNVREILLPAIGRIGVDPLPYLLPFSADMQSSPYQSSPRVLGACFAEKKWAPVLIVALRDAYHSGSARVDRGYVEMVLKALANLGDQDFVEQELASNTKIDQVRLRSKIDRYSKNSNPPNGLCTVW